MAENPFQQYGGINESGAMNEYRAMRMMSMAERGSREPFPRTHFAGGRGGLGQNPMLASMLGSEMQEPDYSGFTYDPAAHAAASKFLGQYYGLSPLSPAQVNPNAFLPNTGFFGRHPKLAGALEGAVFGAAATRGSDTIGEGISNVAGGLLEGRAARQGMINRQFAQPFNQAHMLEGMEDMAMNRELKAMDIEHLRHVNQHLDDAVPRQFGSTAIPSMGQLATTDVGTGEVKFTPIPRTNMPPPKTTHTGEGSEFNRIVDARNAELAQQGKPPLGSNGLLAISNRISGGRADATTVASLLAQFRLGGKDPTSLKQALKANGINYIKPDNKEARDSIYKSIILDPNYKGSPVGQDVENAIDAEINRRNQATFEKEAEIRDQYESQSIQNSGGANPMPTQPKVPTYNPKTGRLE